MSMLNKGNDAAFAPFIARTAGDRLVLRRRMKVADRIVRLLIHVMVGLPCALIALMGFAIATRPTGVGGAIFAVVAVPVLLGLSWLMLRLLDHDGVERIEVSPRGLELSGSRGFFRRRTVALPAAKISAISGQPRSVRARPYLPVTWSLAIVAASDEGLVDLGWLVMADETDETPWRALAEIADRLAVPVARGWPD